MKTKKHDVSVLPQNVWLGNF